MGSVTEETQFYSVFVIGTLGLFLNGVLFFVIFSKKELYKAGYMIFILCRAFADFVWCLHYLILQPIGVKYWESNPIWCTIAGGTTDSLVLIIMLSEPLLACNRYVAICHKNLYPKIYKKRYPELMCLASWILGILLCIPKMQDGSLGRIPGLYCSTNLEKASMAYLLIFDYPVLMSNYVVVIYCYCKIFYVLRSHQIEMTNSGISSQTQDDKSLLKYIGTMAVMPLVTETPAGVADLIYMKYPALIPDFILFLTAFLFAFCPIFNSIITLLMVRPIRKEFFLRITSLFNKNQVKPVNVIFLQ